MFFSDKGPTLETLDFTIRTGGAPTFKTTPLLFYCLTPDDFTRQGKASMWKRVNWAYLSMCLRQPFPFVPRLAQLNHPFIILRSVLSARQRQIIIQLLFVKLNRWKKSTVVDKGQTVRVSHIYCFHVIVNINQSINQPINQPINQSIKSYFYFTLFFYSYISNNITEYKSTFED